MAGVSYPTGPQRKYRAQLIGINKLSELSIDESKEWGNFKIKNIGTPTVRTDASRGGWVSIGSVVFSGSPTATNTFQDLDLGDTAGTSGSVVVLLKMKSNVLGAFCVRPNGDTEITQYASDAGHAGGGYVAANAALLAMTETDTNGIIEWKLTNAVNATVEILLYGYIRQV